MREIATVAMMGQLPYYLVVTNAVSLIVADLCNTY